jgi:hypothetical protein
MGSCVPPVRTAVTSTPSPWPTTPTWSSLLGSRTARETHGCDPNLWWADEYTLVARPDIEADAELTSDYATSTGEEGFAMPCRCGAAVCRGAVAVVAAVHVARARNPSQLRVTGGSGGPGRLAGAAGSVGRADSAMAVPVGRPSWKLARSPLRRRAGGAESGGIGDPTS